MNIRRTTFVVTQKCTLKCKMCLAFIPYFENPINTSLEDAKVILDNYFRIIDYVEIFSVTGGEPLINPDLTEIMRYVFTYKSQIRKHIDIVTNGTILFKKDILELFSDNKDLVRVIISNYGKDLSPRVNEIEQQLRDIGIEYRIQNYDIAAEEWTYSGWVDFSDHSIKHKTLEEVKQQGKRCIFKLGHYYVINDGELHPCSRQYWRMRQGIMEKNQGWFIDLNQKNLDVDAEKRKLGFLEETEYLNSCAYCNGVWNGIQRHRPAEQL